MFFKERCSLCGGKLDSGNVCTECGLDNNKSEKHYRVNRSSCDGQPLTHVHQPEYDSRRKDRSRQEREQKEKERSALAQSSGSRARSGRSRKKAQPYNTYIEGEKRDRRSRVGKLVTVIIILVIVVSVIFPLVDQYIDESQYDSYTDYESYEDYDYDPYAYVIREIPADGVSYSQQFAQGDYVVGVHIPEGTYVMEGQGDNYISLSVDDAENGIYLYESVDDEVTSVDDIRLYTGAVVSISGDGYLTLSADNAQAEQTTGGLPNPLTESVRISGGQTLTVGEDFPAGVYDLSAVSGYGAPEITICDQEGNELQTLYPWLTDSSETESIYRNVVLPQGAVFSNTDEELELELVPSEAIVSEDYLGYYDRY